jgi:hypothetical protein
VVVKRTFAWRNQFRRLRIRYDRRVDIHEAFLSLGCVWILLEVAAQGNGLQLERSRPVAVLALARLRFNSRYTCQLKELKV